MNLFDIFRRKANKTQAVFLGLDNAGKSTIISFLKEGRFIEHTPTMGKNKSDMEINGTRISIMDVGGQATFRDMWFDELRTANLVVFVIDEAAPERFPEAKMEFDKLLPNIIARETPLLILANKHDMEIIADLPTIIKAFGLLELKNFEILEISARSGYGMADAFVKFYNTLTGEQIRRMRLAKAISIFDKTGKSITSKINVSEEIERQSIEVGFTGAIASLQNNGQIDNKEFEITLFESEEHGTFILAETMHYIGSLLWTMDLGVTIEQAKIALHDLLEQLEHVVQDHDDLNSVTFYVDQYATNII